MATHVKPKLQLIVECLFLLHNEDNSETMTSSLLNFCIKDTLAIMTAPLSNFSLQLIDESPSLLLRCDFERPAITTRTNDSFSFKFFVESILDGERFTPNFDQRSNLDSSKIIVIFLKISFHFCEDYRIFCEGEYQEKNDGYSIDKLRSPNNIPNVGKKQQGSIKSNDDANDECQQEKKDGEAIRNAKAVELIIVGLVNRNSAFGHNYSAFSCNLAIGHNLVIGLNLAAIGCNLAFGRIMAFGHNELIDLNMAFGLNKLIKLILAFGHNELIELTMTFSHNELIQPNDVGPSNLIVKYSINLPFLKHQLFTFGRSALATHRFIGYVCFGPIVSIYKIAATAKLLRRIKHAATHGVGTGIRELPELPTRSQPQFIISLPHRFAFI
jgi:hypothetical protein